MSSIVVTAAVAAAAAAVVVILIDIFYFTWSFQFDAIFHIISHFIYRHRHASQNTHTHTQSFWLCLCLRQRELELSLATYIWKSDALRLGHERQSTQQKKWNEMWIKHSIMLCYGYAVRYKTIWGIRVWSTVSLAHKRFTSIVAVAVALTPSHFWPLALCICSSISLSIPYYPLLEQSCSLFLVFCVLITCFQ